MTNNKNMNYSVAFILTRYQYNILLIALEKLNIDNSSVVIIVAKKAQKQGVLGIGFKKVLFYDDKNEGIGNWLGLKDKINYLLQEIDFCPENIFLRNFNATISRVLMSYYPEATLYLLEEGMPSYMKGNYFGCPSRIREKAKTLLTRFHFSKRWLKILPVNRKKTIKVGLFESMKPWLDVPFLPVKLSQKNFKMPCEDLIDNTYNYDVFIIDQPLWQVGLNSEQTRDIYKQLLNYLVEKGLQKKKIAIKLHPSSDKQELKSLLDELEHENSIEIIDSKENIEELLFTNQLNSVKIFIGFFSWAMCLIQANKQDESVQVICFSNQTLEQKVHEAYQIMESMRITIERDKNEK